MSANAGNDDPLQALRIMSKYVATYKNNSPKLVRSVAQLSTTSRDFDNHASITSSVRVQSETPLREARVEYIQADKAPSAQEKTTKYWQLYFATVYSENWKHVAEDEKKRYLRGLFQPGDIVVFQETVPFDLKNPFADVKPIMPLFYINRKRECKPFKTDEQGRFHIPANSGVYSYFYRKNPSFGLDAHRLGTERVYEWNKIVLDKPEISSPKK